MLKPANSLRSYAISIYDAEIGSMVKFKVVDTISFNRIYNCLPDELEYIYALRDRIDELMDLRVGKAMYFQPNRDNKNSKAIIVRL